jgi:transcriptional regulator with XRE-family HTH domain
MLSIVAQKRMLANIMSEASKLLTDAAAALAEGDFDRAFALKEQAEAIEPRLNRKARQMGFETPKDIPELMPLLRRKDAAGPVLRDLRQSLGLTQVRVAEICGVSQNAVAQWEIGRNPVSQAAVEKLVHWMGAQGTREFTAGPPPAALLKLRKSLGFTQAALAAKLDLRESVVRRAESGNLPLSMEQAERYRRIAAQHGVDLDQLAA